MALWQMDYSPFFRSRFLYYKKNNPLEMQAMMNNLDTYEKALNFGVRAQFVQGSYIHHESMGIKAIDQSGAKHGNTKELRLYVYPDEKTSILHLITVGDKHSQNADINECKKYLKTLS